MLSFKLLPKPFSIGFPLKPYALRRQIKYYLKFSLKHAFNSVFPERFKKFLFLKAEGLPIFIGRGKKKRHSSASSMGPKTLYCSGIWYKIPENLRRGCRTKTLKITKNSFTNSIVKRSHMP